MAPPGVQSAETVMRSAVKASSVGVRGGYSKRAYVTFLAGSGDYVKGVVGLVKGLRKVRSVYPLIVAVLPDVPEEHRCVLRGQGCIVREIEPIYPPDNQIQFAMAYYVINYSKLRIWEFEEYSKLIYLDADIQVYENIDHLFDLPDGHFYAVMDCFCEKTWSHTPQYRIGYCQQCPEKVKWPAELGETPALYFNAGMFVFEPSKLTYESLLNTLRVTPPTPFAEQDFLNMFFKNIYRPIPHIYNLVMAMLWRHPERIDLDKTKVVHYCANGSKPWRYTGKEENMDREDRAGPEGRRHKPLHRASKNFAKKRASFQISGPALREDIKMLVNKWWEIYKDPSLDFKATDTIPAGETPSELQQIADKSIRVAIPVANRLVSLPPAA